MIGGGGEGQGFPGRAFARAVGVAGAGSFVGFGVWGMAAPRSFFERFATFEPDNQLLIHVASHVVGPDLGGRPEVDVPVVAVLAALLVAAGVFSWPTSPGRIRVRQ